MEDDRSTLNDEPIGLREELGIRLAEPGIQPVIKLVEVEGLYDRFDYRLDLQVNDGDPRLTLLYGENGAGKTTILRLLWHLLSASNNRGHRTALRKANFRRLSVELSDGSCIAAEKVWSAAPSMTVKYYLGGELQITSEWEADRDNFEDFEVEFLRAEMERFPEDLKHSAANAIGRIELISRLQSLGITPYFLADDRRFYSDDMDRLPSRPGRISPPSPVHTPEEGNSVVEQELSVALRRVSQLFQQLAVGGTATGSANANSVYLDVLQRLAGKLVDSGHDTDVSTLNLRDELAVLGERNGHLHSLNLVPRFATKEFLDSLDQLDNTRAGIAQEVLGPFLVSLKARLDALQPAAELINTYLTEVNGFMADKQLSFDPRRGIRIAVRGEDPIRPEALSSGERQLVLLLSNAMLARRGTKLFIIDEPELSLNVKWQRNIVKSLLACTAGAPVQFLIATHSVEILAHYRANIAKLSS